MPSLAKEAARQGPKSWADDLNSYRAVRGANAFATTRDLSEPVARQTRTSLMPVGNPTHPYFSYKEPQQDESDPLVQARHVRRGLGDVSLLKDGIEGVHRAGVQPPSGRMKVADPSKEDMFSMIQCRNPRNEPDAWFGHPAIDPSFGKKAVPPPYDPKGRMDLFEVLNQAKPGLPGDDTWMGNILIDPGKGKRACPGPEQRMGRKDLFPVLQQNIMRDPERVAKLYRGGDGAYADAWIGNRLIHPAKGKLEIAGTECTDVHMIGPSLKSGIPDTDFPRPGRRIIEPNETTGHSHHDTVHALYAGTATYDDWKSRVKSRRHFGTVPRPRAGAGPLRVDLADVLQRDAVGADEAARLQYRWAEDVPVRRKQVCNVPGSRHPSTGPDMLYWKPDEQVASYVPYGKKAQVQYDIADATRVFTKDCDYKPAWKS